MWFKFRCICLPYLLCLAAYGEDKHWHSDSEAIVRIAGDLSWRLSENAVFEQVLSSEIGSNTAISRCVSSVKTAILGQLAMRFSYAVKHNSKAPDATGKTDTETSVTLVYSF